MKDNDMKMYYKNTNKICWQLLRNICYDSDGTELSEFFFEFHLHAC